MAALFCRRRAAAATPPPPPLSPPVARHVVTLECGARVPLHYASPPGGAPRRPPTFFVMLPGNPGVPDCYTRYLAAVAAAAAGDAAVAGGAGFPLHTLTIGHTAHTADTACDTRYSLDDQLAHKRAVLAALLDAHPDARLVLAGHSVGAYMVVELLRSLPPAAVVRCVLLTPTLSNIGASPNGVRLTPLFRYAPPLAGLLTGVLAALPQPVAAGVLKWAVAEARADDATLRSLLPLVHRAVPVNALHLAATEMADIGPLDAAHLRAHAGKLDFYYAPGDGWVADTDAAAAQALVSGVPGARVVRCDEGHTHAFVLSGASSERLGRRTWSWIRDAVLAAAGSDGAGDGDCGSSAPPPTAAGRSSSGSMGKVARVRDFPQLLLHAPQPGASLSGHER
jgi:hypothetical protein